MTTRKIPPAKPPALRAPTTADHIANAIVGGHSVIVTVEHHGCKVLGLLDNDPSRALVQFSDGTKTNIGVDQIKDIRRSFPPNRADKARKAKKSKTRARKTGRSRIERTMSRIERTILRGAEAAAPPPPTSSSQVDAGTDFDLAQHELEGGGNGQDDVASARVSDETTGAAASG